MSFTYLIIGITVLVSLAAWRGIAGFTNLNLYPYALHKKPAQISLLGHAFVHADWQHLLVNMFVLFSFGSNVEFTLKQVLGNELAYLALTGLYLGGILASAIPALVKHKNNPHYQALGASGAVSAVTFASILFYPTSAINFIFLPFLDIPAFVFGILYLAYEYYMNKKGNDGIAHDAHFWGALYGVVFISILFPGVLPFFVEQISNYL